MCCDNPVNFSLVYSNFPFKFRFNKKYVLEEDEEDEEAEDTKHSLQLIEMNFVSQFRRLNLNLLDLKSDVS